MSKQVNLKPWLEARLGKRVEKHGVEWGIPCPECDVGRAKEFRLWWNTEKNVGTCYKCHRAFNTVSLVQAVEAVSFAGALRLVKEHTVGGVLSLAGLQQRVKQAFAAPIVEKVEPLAPIDLPPEFIAASNAPEDEWPAYLMERVGSRKTILDYGIGWCSRGFYANRMVVPVRMAGATVSFVARDMTGRAERKVLYPKGTKTSRMLFNYDRASQFDQVVLVEGVLDALRVGPRGMAIFGTSLSDAQVRLLADSQAREVVVMLDGDDAGVLGTSKLVARLRTTHRVRVVRLPSGRDPDDFSRASLHARIEGATVETLAGRVRRALIR